MMRALTIALAICLALIAVMVASYVGAGAAIYHLRDESAKTIVPDYIAPKFRRQPNLVEVETSKCWIVVNTTTRTWDGHCKE